MSSIPPRQELLHRFVQVSDLHIGEVDLSCGNATVGSFAQTVYSNIDLFDGLLGHSGQALQHLEAFIAGLQQANERFELIVTGDFTRCGGSTDITAATSYFTGALQLHHAGNATGLGLPQMPDASIPGNHDHWGGRNQPLGGGPLAAGALIPKTFPYVTQRPLLYGITLVLAGIDTDAAVHPLSLKRFMAVGSFQQQLASLQGMLTPKAKREVRILLSHHSHAWGGNLLRMDAGSRQGLEQFLVDNEFDVLLTGHTHAPLLTKTSMSGGGNSRAVRELRCGTSTQHQVVPLNWRRAFGGLPRKRWPKNTLLVHDIYGGPTYLRWCTQGFVREVGGFKNGGSALMRQFPL